MRRALTGNTEGIEVDASAGVPGRGDFLADNTGDAVVRGADYAVAAVINHTVASVKVEREGDLACLLTGGDAKRILPLLHGDYQHEPHWVLKGLAIAAGTASGPTK